MSHDSIWTPRHALRCPLTQSDTLSVKVTLIMNYRLQRLKHSRPLRLDICCYLEKTTQLARAHERARSIDHLAANASLNAHHISRRTVLPSFMALVASLVMPRASASATRLNLDVPEPHISPSLAPDQSTYDPNDQNLRDAYNMLQSGLNATSVEREEAIWSGG